MRKLVSLFAVAVFFATTVAAQDPQESPCRLRFAVAEKYDRWGVWPDDARQWWAKDGKKKFPELCEAAFEDADFGIAWEKTWTTVKYIVPILTRDTRPISREICVQSGDFTTYSCTTYTEYEVYDRVDFEDQETQVEQLSVIISRMQADKRVRVKTIVNKGDKPGKASFQSAMKAIRKENKKAVAGPLR